MRGHGWVGLLLCLGLAAGPDGAGAQVVSDGSTATSVVVNSDGSVTIGVAPTGRSGVSLNRFDSFNVAAPGVQLDNRTEAARTIVSEVTGTGQTRLEGPLEVLGQRAHVILANPNGIMIDGGRFVNTGRVALTTGAVSVVPREIAPRIFQDNVVARVTGGGITVSGAGLSGQMDAVDLIARTIQVTGPVTNSSANENAGLRLLAGQNSVEFDSSVLPGNTGLSWGRVTGLGAQSPGSVLVELGTGGVLRAGQVSIEVSDLGAGVRLAGQGFATSRAFSVQADGQVVIDAAQIEAASGVFVSGRGVAVQGAALSGGAGAVSLLSQGNAAALTVEGSRLTGTDILLTSGAALRFGGVTGGAVLRATTGNILAEAAGELVDHRGDLEAFGSVVMVAQGNLDFTDSRIVAGGSAQLDSAARWTSTGAQIEAAGHVLLTGADIVLKTGQAPTAITARNGALIATTTGTGQDRGNLSNTGGTLQGGQNAPEVTNTAGLAGTGAVTLNVAGDLINTTDADLAVIFGAAGDVVIRTGRDVQNNRGRILANGDIRLLAAGDVLNLVDAAETAEVPVVSDYARAGRRIWWTLWIRRRHESGVRYDYGHLARPDRLATITATGSLSILARHLINRGGSINANDGDLQIEALSVETIGLGSGKIEVQRVCGLRCDDVGAGSVEIFGGLINAGGALTLRAAEAFENRAGQVFALGDITITTPQATLEAALVPVLVQRPKGLYNFWSSQAAWVFLRDQFGGVVSDTGRVTLNSPAPLRVLGGFVTGRAGVDLPAGQDIVRAPGILSGAAADRIGLFADVPPVRWD